MTKKRIVIMLFYLLCNIAIQLFGKDVLYNVKYTCLFIFIYLKNAEIQANQIKSCNHKQMSAVEMLVQC